MRTTFALLTFAFCVLARAEAAPSPLHPTTFAQVSEYLRTHPEVRTADQFIGALSPERRNRFVLMHETGSLHRDCVTPANPRVIFTDAPSAKLIIAVANSNGSAKCSTANSVEFIEYIGKDARFEMHSVDFEATGPVISVANPPKCLTCHTRDPRPIWGSYFMWNGAYGSLDDTALTKKMVNASSTPANWPSEYEALETFMASKRQQGIYRHLNWANGRDELNCGRPQYPESGSGAAGVHDEFNRPNFAFHRGLVSNNRPRVARLLRSQLDFDTFKYAIYYAQQCSKVSGVGEIVSSLPESARARFAGINLPQAIPQTVKDQYFKTGDLNLLKPLNAFLADQLRRYELARAHEESLVPKEWWGFLREGDLGNPTNTELPRIPKAMGLLPGEFVAPVEYFLSVQGKSTRGWFLPLEGYIGTEGEESMTRVLDREVDNLSCAQVKARAIEAITEWAAL